ncbi:MAG: methyltransferase domain-containing protein [bacterium]|nr:methyltransferase domain-containing protein [bacterium]
MNILSFISQKIKIRYFIREIPKNAMILEIGSGSMWLSKYMRNNGWSGYLGIDMIPPAEIVGDIKEWRRLGLKEESFDYIIAFEVLEHIDIIPEALALLKDKGKLLITTPYPKADKILEFFEKIKLNQRRTSAHTNLIFLKNIKNFSNYRILNILSLSQRGKFTK